MVEERFIDFGGGAADHAGADFSGRERDRVYVSRGGKGFSEVSYLSGADSIEDGRAFARVDLDRDGYEDAVVMNRNAPLMRLFLNRVGPSRGSSFVGLELVGVPGPPRPGVPRSTREAVGARVTAECGGRRVTAEHALGGGMGVINSRVLTLGLDRCEKLDSLTVRFPSGRVESAKDLPARRRYVVTEGAGIVEVPGVYDRTPVVAPAPPSPSPVDSPAAVLLAAAAAPERDLVLIELWATWCEACRTQRPRLDELATRFGDRIAVAGLSVEPGDDQAAVDAYLRLHPTSHPLRPYSAAATRAAEGLLGGSIVATPTVLLLDRRTGKVELARPGIPTTSEVERILWRRAR